MIVTDEKIINEFLDRGVSAVYPSKEYLKKELLSGKQLSIYLGVDPTGPNLHIGHMICLNKLSQFQKLGHKVIFLIGSFTAMIGDPTGKSSSRKQLTREDVLENCKRYKEQASVYLNFEGENPVELKYNSDWHDKLTFKEVVELSSHFTVNQMIEREMFQERLKFDFECPFCGIRQLYSRAHQTKYGIESDLRGKELVDDRVCENCGKKIRNEEIKNIHKPQPIGLHEFLYPLMQGYDSVAMNVDGEIGGNDQIFNMLAGRDLIKDLKNKEKFVVAMKLLTDSTGKKMGKSEGNMISLGDSSKDMFGKIMSWTDGMIMSGFDLCTNISNEKIKEYEQQLKNGVNPRDLKIVLAEEILKIYFGEKIAKQEVDNFISQFSEKRLPESIDSIRIAGQQSVLDLLVYSGMCSSKTEARKMIEQGAVKVYDKDENMRKVSDINEIIDIDKENIVQVGKLKYIKIVK